MKVILNGKKYRRTYDFQIGLDVAMEEMADQVLLCYSQTKKVSAFVAPRDFLVVFNANFSSDGTLYMPFFSIDRDDLSP